MIKTTSIQTLPLESRAEGVGSHTPTVLCTEWTPCIMSNIPIRSTWRPAIGVPLTDARIRKHAYSGYYGTDAQLRERARRETVAETRNRRAVKRRLLEKILARYV